MLVCKVGLYMSQMIQSHHFPFSLCWHELTVGGGGLKKQKLHKNLSDWTKKKALLQMHCCQWPSDTIVITSIISTNEKMTDAQSHWWWGCWNLDPLADHGVLKTLKSVRPGIKLQFNHLLAGDFAYVIRSEPWFPHELSGENVPTSQGGWDKSPRAISTPSVSAPFSG